MRCAGAWVHPPAGKSGWGDVGFFWCLGLGTSPGRKNWLAGCKAFGSRRPGDIPRQEKRAGGMLLCELAYIPGGNHWLGGCKIFRSRELAYIPRYEILAGGMHDVPAAGTCLRPPEGITGWRDASLAITGRSRLLLPGKRGACPCGPSGSRTGSGRCSGRCSRCSRRREAPRPPRQDRRSLRRRRRHS